MCGVDCEHVYLFMRKFFSPLEIVPGRTDCGTHAQPALLILRSARKLDLFLNVFYSDQPFEIEFIVDNQKLLDPVPLQDSLGFVERCADCNRDEIVFHTSNDVVDTAQALLIRQASQVIAQDLQRLAEVLERRAWEFKDSPMVGRTHGIHAEPITFGFKLANWYSETQRNIARFMAAAEDMRVGKFSGAVGIFAHLTPELEEKICARLGLNAAAISSQVIQRDRHAHYLGTLAVIASTLDKIATEVRHLQRTEVGEAEEFFSEKQKGSSAMPHKRNPVTAEQISGLSRVVRSNAQAGLENVALWHERDISHSSAERVILPDSTTLADYLLTKTTNLIDTLFVYPERMRANLGSTRGLIFSGQLLLDLVEHGVSREDAYRVVQSHAMRAWKENLDFHQLILGDKEITSKVPRQQIEYAFDLPRQLKNVDRIFARVFGGKESKKSSKRERPTRKKKK